MPPTATLPLAAVLTGPQIGELAHILCRLFDLGELRRFALFRLDLNMDEVAPQNATLPVAVESLITLLLRHGRISELLDHATTDRPNDDALHQFVTRMQNGAGAVPVREQVRELVEGIALATKTARDDPAAQARLTAARDRFQFTRTELTRLARYKALHDCLHALQLQLAAVALAARAFPADPASARALAALAEQLQRQAQRARRSTTGLTNGAAELEWVDDFDQALGEVRAALRPATHPLPGDRPAAERLRGAVDALTRLPTQAVRLNEQLVAAATRLGEW
ncbi:effector-associated domain EAD1-containing protein, partial [Gemmata sp. JC673]